MKDFCSVVNVTMAILLSFNGLNPGNASADSEIASASSVPVIMVSVDSKRKKKIRNNTMATMTSREGSKNLRGKACFVGE